MPNTENTTTQNDEEIRALKKQLAAAQKKLKAAQQQSNSGFTMKVSQKGAMSLYGMGRFPVTLYRNQWEKVLNFSDQIKAFLDANEDKLAKKE